MPSHPLSHIMGRVPSYRQALGKLANNASLQVRQKAKASALTHSIARTAGVVAGAGLASTAAGRFPSYVENKYIDGRLAAGAVLGVAAAVRKSRGKGGTGQALAEGVADGWLASYIADKGRAWGERMKRDADTGYSAPSAASADTAAKSTNAPAVKGTERILLTEEPSFSGSRPAGRARRLSEYADL